MVGEGLRKTDSCPAAQLTKTLQNALQACSKTVLVGGIRAVKQAGDLTTLQR